jgi:hypothetical protein
VSVSEVHEFSVSGILIFRKRLLSKTIGGGDWLNQDGAPTPF